MTADQGRFFCSLVSVLCAVAIVLLGATGCREFGAYAATVCVLAMAVFIGATLDA